MYFLQYVSYVCIHKQRRTSWVYPNDKPVRKSAITLESVAEDCFEIDDSVDYMIMLVHDELVHELNAL